MPCYEVKHRYRASRDGQTVGPWEPGQRVELAEAEAAWINRDSPGALAEVKPSGARQGQAQADRQHRGGANR